jgi:hypothetical protein
MLGSYNARYTLTPGQNRTTRPQHHLRVETMCQVYQEAGRVTIQRERTEPEDILKESNN